MLIHEYAERIYTSASLEEKLLAPVVLEDSDVPAPPWRTFGLPARSDGLELDGDNERARFGFPKLHELENETRRGHALHFFANHELLALELMALMLLRFPDADPTFRKTLVNTMKDEQRHLQLYLARMDELGVSFGEIPVNSFFYDHIATVDSLQDFVVRMSLTFEQANLDFSLFYAKAFEEIGDSTTQAIMEEVLHDEIAHVAHGVRWFNQWRARGESMWEAYRKELAFPLTPARAKGMQFFRAPRKRAGLPQDFIDRLRVYNHSKGRSPEVWLYAPDVEEHRGHPDGDYVPNKAVAAMQRDLRTLPMLMAKRDDVVLVDEAPCPHYLNEMFDLGFTIPEFVVADLTRPRLPKKHELVERKVARLQPWGWSPRIERFLGPLSPQVSPTPGSEEQHSAARFSKAWFAERYDRLTSDLPFHEYCVPSPAPCVVRTFDDALEKAHALFEAGFPMVVVKAPWGASGRRNLRLLPGEPNDRQAVWMRKILATQGALVLEGLFEKVTDLSFQFDVDDAGEFRRRGLTRPITDGLGRFRGLVLTRPLKDLDDASRDFAFQGTGNAKWIDRTLEHVAQRITTELVAQGYRGPAGLDAMLVRHNDTLKLRPLVEVNVRFTMGRVGLALAERAAPGRSSLWCMLSQRDLHAAGHETFEAAVAALQAALPTDVLEDKPRRIRRGAIPTNNPGVSQQVLAVLLVGDSKHELESALATAGFGGVFPV